jgi:hypothetical protein
MKRKTILIAAAAMCLAGALLLGMGTLRAASSDPNNPPPQDKSGKQSAYIL